MAQKVLRSIRSDDVAARVGGDEFLIFMSCTTDQVEPLIRRIFTSLTGTYRDFPISLSLGVALAPEHGTDYETLFNRADQALYAAKKNGRNQYCLTTALSRVISPSSRLSTATATSLPRTPDPFPVLHLLFRDGGRFFCSFS